MRRAGLRQPRPHILWRPGVRPPPTPARGRRRAGRAPRRSAWPRRSARRSMGARVRVSKPSIGRSPPGIGAARRHHLQVLDADAVGAFLVVAGLVGDDHARAQGDGVAAAWRSAAGPRGRRGRSRRRGRCRGRSRGRPPTAAARARASRAEPVVPAGKRTRASARWPFSTRVKRSAHLRRWARRWPRCG